MRLTDMGLKGRKIIEIIVIVIMYALMLISPMAIVGGIIGMGIAFYHENFLAPSLCLYFGGVALLIASYTILRHYEEKQ